MSSNLPKPAGVDEAGRGPLAGSVFAAAVILDPSKPIVGLNDSKKLSAATRERLSIEIRDRALAWAIAEASAKEIDQHNILRATMLAMQRAVAALALVPDEVLVDGNRAPKFMVGSAIVPSQTIVKGDALVPAISAASILAKTARDAALLALHVEYPDYGFDGHKGYPTPEHLARLKELGPCPAHRVSFAPVREAAGLVGRQVALW
jgi:ribonuclease HII